MSFSESFDSFLNSVKRHDLEGLSQFLDPELPFRALLPDGVPILTVKEFLASQRSYFENPNASFEYEIISCEESETLGFGVCKADVKVPFKEEIRSLHLQICFLFRKIKGQWILVFDQNSELRS